ncbi:MAG: hypothetical protein M1831_005834 [Alyxoria varia]|nr:MAG: hypothetical protein M1831_005834 [Alyxoria varia]
MAQSSPIANGVHANHTPNGPTKPKKPHFFTPPALLATKRKQPDSGESPDNRSSTRPLSFHDLDAERQRQHRERVEEALQEHEAVRERASRAHELFKLEMEKRRLAQALKEQEAMERARREVEEKENMLRQQRREGEENQKRQEQQRVEEDRAKRDEAIRLEERRKIEERERQERIKREEAEAAQGRAQQQSTPQQPIAPAAPSQSTSTSPTAWDGIRTPQAARDAEHKRYLNLHKSLKQMRQQVLDHAKSNPDLKTQLGNWRRQIKKTIGQLTDNNGRPPPQTKVLQDLLLASKNIRNTQRLDVRHYMIHPDPTIADAEAQVTGSFIYELNIVAKSIVRQLTSEASAEAKTAGPVGLLAIAVFSREQFRFGANGNASLIDILLAKLHKLCPVLFGIWGNESTQGGRERLGWGKDDSEEWLPEQNQFDRIAGIAAGYASMSLRNFPARGPSNPHPPTEFWKSLARIVDVPAHEVTQTHLIIVKAMIEAQLERFKKCFGDFVVKAAVRKAVVDLAARAKDGIGKKALASLPTVLRMQYKFEI